MEDFTAFQLGAISGELRAQRMEKLVDTYFGSHEDRRANQRVNAMRDQFNDILAQQNQEWRAWGEKLQAAANGKLNEMQRELTEALARAEVAERQLRECETKLRYADETIERLDLEVMNLDMDLSLFRNEPHERYADAEKADDRAIDPDLSDDDIP